MYPILPDDPKSVAWLFAADSARTDSLMDALESRVEALERVAATPWPWRIVASHRLGRAIRRSVAEVTYVGPDFHARRVEAVTNDWLARPRPQLPPAVPGTEPAGPPCPRCGTVGDDSCCAYMAGYRAWQAL